MIDRARLGVTVFAVWLGVSGAALLFAPREISTRLGASGPDVVYQLLAAALLGLAAMNHVARGSALGGIYGRAVVTADQVHFTIGALVLIKLALRHSVAPALWIAILAYVAGAVFFNLLLFHGVRPPAQAPPPPPEVGLPSGG
ncbi:MAG: hypothetical protein V7647_1400 [Acidobacteriota bacterium]|jgi:hypothetical protein